MRQLIPRRISTVLCVSTLLLLEYGIGTSSALAGVIFLGPVPYLSERDSPFLNGDVSRGVFREFFLEDFEDGELNTPGVYYPLLSLTHPGVVAPSPFTDSVDGDSGPIDGDGISGHSLRSRTSVVALSDPPQVMWFIRFAFDRDELGYLPNTFGFVWTDGMQDSKVKIELFDEDSNMFATHKYSEFFGDEFFTGTTSDDRFVGVVSDREIFTVQITSRHVGQGPAFEMDHLQYGLLVPEPNGTMMFLIGVLCLALRQRRTKRQSSANAESP